MKYLCRPGIERVCICGEYLLVPSRQAFAYCKTVQHLSLLAASLWEDLEKGKDPYDVCKSFGRMTGRPEVIHDKVAMILEDLCRKDFLIKTEDDHE